eukprot:TRINITY_DN18570_c0_g1_i1.p2 TRINITY_DN18570_c0_g1~~TRINITY_DN18570_c0_g1_i1.p2  ORF type:complete len:332 (+),score=42.72 TRINITY_DN18570_c0_g1_i1:233-1228(+)
MNPTTRREALVSSKPMEIILSPSGFRMVRINVCSDSSTMNRNCWQMSPHPIERQQETLPFPKKTPLAQRLKSRERAKQIYMIAAPGSIAIPKQAMRCHTLISGIVPLSGTRSIALKPNHPVVSVGSKYVQKTSSITGCVQKRTRKRMAKRLLGFVILSMGFPYCLAMSNYCQTINLICQCSGTINFPHCSEGANPCPRLDRTDLQADMPVPTSADLEGSALELYCKVGEAEHGFLKSAVEKLGLSARAYTRVLRISRTIADLAGEETIRVDHLAEAINYRTMDRQGQFPELFLFISILIVFKNIAGLTVQIVAYGVQGREAYSLCLARLEN